MSSLPALAAPKEGSIVLAQSATAAEDAAKSAQAQFAQAESAAAATEQNASATSVSIAEARQRRAATAGAWRDAARQWAASAPDDAQARAEVTAAEQAARKYFMPSGVHP